MSKIINVGRVTSYADAVAGGYTGTREQWEHDLANLGTVAAEVEADRAEVAENTATVAEDKAAVEEDKSAAESAAGSAAESAASAHTDAIAATAAKEAAQTAQGLAENAASTAANAKDAAQTAQGAAEDAQTAAEAAQTGAEDAQTAAAGSASAAAESATAAAGSASAAAESEATAQHIADMYPTDKTLSVVDKAADGKATGDAVADLKSAIEDIATIGTQLFDKDNPDLINAFPTGGSVVSNAGTTSVIVPISPSITDTNLTVHREIISSRFGVATFTAKPTAGSSYVTMVNNNSAESITVAISTSIRYVMIYMHRAESDTDITVADVLNGLMVEYGSRYTGYEDFKNVIIIPDGFISSAKFGADVPAYIKTQAADSNVQTIVEGNSEYSQTNMTQSLSWTSGKLYNLTTGALETNAQFSYTAKFSISACDAVGVTNHSGWILFWDADGNYLGYKSTPSNSTKYYPAPANAKYYAFNNNSSDTRASSVLVTSYENAVVSENKTSPAKLLLDDSAFVTGMYVATNSGYISYGVANFYCAFPIKVEPNHKYRTKTQAQLVFFDADMTFISGSLPEGGANMTGVLVERDFTTPATCEYLAINTTNKHEMLFDLEYDSYTTFDGQKLSGLNVVCFGDSITGNYGFGDNYPYQIEKLTGAKTYNCGFGGCRMELINDDTAHTNPFSMVGIVDSLESGDWTEQDQYASGISNLVPFRLGILKNIDFDDVDVVTIAYGTNEYGYPQDDPEDPMNTHTYAGATRYSVNKLLTLYPHLRILLLTPIFRWFSDSDESSDTKIHPTYGGKLTDNVATLISVGHELKIPVIDMYYTLGINSTNYTAYFGDDDEPSDGTHINSFGREQMGRRVAGEINRLF